MKKEICWAIWETMRPLLKIFILPLLLYACLGTNIGHAALVKLNYGATIVGITGTPDSLAVGDTITGYLIYNSDVPASQISGAINGTNAYYPAIQEAAFFANGALLEQFTTPASVNVIHIQDAFGPVEGFDNARWAFRDDDSLGEWSGKFIGTSKTIFSSETLPNPWPESGWDYTKVQNTFLSGPVNDTGGTFSASFNSFSVTPVPENLAPIVAAGTNQTITLPNVASLDGSVSDDGLPYPPATLTTTWSQVSGPAGTTTFADPNAVDTTASFSLHGTYVLRLTADDGVLTNSSEVTIIVNPVPPPVNQAPVVNAGSNQTITLPSVANLDGTVTDDGLPSGTVTTMWSKVSGLGTVIFGNPNSVDTSGSFTLPGTYILRLTANDGALTNSALVTLTVNSNPLLQVPNIRGLWTEGPLSGSSTRCQDPGDNGSFSDPGGETYSITNQTGASFSISEVDTEVDGGDTIVQTTNCSGTVAADGTVSASCTYVVTLNGRFWYSGTSTLTGSLAGNTLNYTLAGQDLVGDTCQWTQTGTDTRSGPVPPPIPIPINDPHDLNGDGKADLVWQNDASHVVAIWLMNGANIGSFAFLGSVPAEWEIKGVGDVNGDGQADLVWKNARSHLVAIWFMNGLTISSISFPGGVSPWWTLEAVGDTNGDGKADLVWVNANTGQVAIWLMNGAVIALAHGKFPLAPVAGDWPNWQLEGTGDVDGNGTADVIWQNTVTGQVTVWLMNGLTLISSVGLPEIPPTYWKIAGMGDVDGNGTSDMVWRNTLNGATAIWFMNGGTIGSFGFPPGVPLAWRISQVGDVNGDGKADVVWQNAKGTVAVWLMNGVTITSVGFPGSAPTAWKIQP